MVNSIFQIRCPKLWQLNNTSKAERDGKTEKLTNNTTQNIFPVSYYKKIEEPYNDIEQ